MTLPGLPAGHLSLGAPQALLPVTLLAAAAIAALVVASVRARGRLRDRGVEIATRSAVVLAVSAALLEPGWTTTQAKPGANTLLLLADDSRSMSVRDQGSDRTRADALRAAFGGGTRTPPWMRTLQSAFALRPYAFDARVRPVDDLGAPGVLRFDGRASALGAALTDLAGRHRGAPVAGIVVFTDGNATDDIESFSGTLPPVYPVVVGGTPEPDLAVGRVLATRTAFEDAPAVVRADIEAIGHRGVPVRATLNDSSGQVVAEQRAEASHDQETLAVTFRFRPPPNASVYEVRVAGPKTEATTANNARLCALEKPPGARRVLYVSGRPNWEYKFLHRALEEDPELSLEALIRIGAREPKFNWAGSGNKSDSNPLYSGFGVDEDAERYDEMVFVRRGMARGSLPEGFPRGPEALFAYDALILDDLEADFFTAAQQDLVARFVTVRGGGLAALAGQESLDRGGWARTPVGQLLPVYLDDGRRVRFSGPVRLELTREGWLEPWVRLAEEENAERARLAAMPGFRVLHRLPSPKPGASVLAEAVDEAGARHPALIFQRAGDGRTLVVAVGDLWRWGLRGVEPQAALGRFWRQTVRQLVADAPRRVSVKVSPEGAHGPGAAKVAVTVKDAAFRAAPDATAMVKVSGPDGTARPLTLEPGDEPGVFEGVFVDGRRGGYVAQAQATGADGSPAGEASMPFAVDPDADELQSLRVRRDRLEALARATGGAVIELDHLDAFARDLPSRPAPVRESHTTPLWHSPWLLAFVIAALLAEWTSRRLRGAA